MLYTNPLRQVIYNYSESNNNSAMAKKVETLKKKRFVISKGLIGKGEVIEFVNAKGDTCV